MCQTSTTPTHSPWVSCVCWWVSSSCCPPAVGDDVSSHQILTRRGGPTDAGRHGLPVTVDASTCQPDMSPPDWLPADWLTLADWLILAVADWLTLAMADCLTLSLTDKQYEYMTCLDIFLCEICETLLSHD